MHQKMRSLWIGMVILYLVVLGYSIWIQIQENDLNGLMMCAVAFFTLWAVPIVFHILHLKPVYEIYNLATVFAFIACVWGSTLGGYDLPFFDKFLHFTSGILMLGGSMLIYALLKGTTVFNTKIEKRTFYVCIIAINMSIALCWEYFEYAMLVFFNNDAIRHYTQGVHDSMTDMICATLAGLLCTAWIYFRPNCFFWKMVNQCMSQRK